MSKRYPYREGRWYIKVIHKLLGCPREWRECSRRLESGSNALWQCECGAVFGWEEVKK